MLILAIACGVQLRQEDPKSLKDIAALLNAQVARFSPEALSVRTKFTIETIEHLKNNRIRTSIVASSLRSERVIAMKKILGSMNKGSIKVSEPLRVGLEDIRNSHRKGRWWLVGASYRGEEENAPSNNSKMLEPQDTEENEDTEDPHMPMKLLELAREQRMNTDIRRSIFVTILSSRDYKDAHVQLLKLGMKKAQEAEIPKVIIRCARAERAYNPYYTLLSKKLCTDRKIKMAFQFSFWDLLKRMEDDDDLSDTEQTGNVDMQGLVNVAKMYGTLISEGSLTVLIMKVVDTHPNAASSANS